MYEPNHRDAKALQQTSRHLDYVTKSAYANYVDQKRSRTWIRWSVEQAVIAAKNTQTTPLVVLWMAQDQDNPDDIRDIPAWTRHDVYLSLITGAKGIIVFSGWRGRAGFQNHFDKFYDGYISAAKELNGSKQLAAIFLSGTPRNDISIAVTSGPEKQAFIYRDKRHIYPTVSWLHTVYNGKNYLFIVNSANEQVRIALNGISDEQKLINVFNERGISQSNIEILERYEVKALSWSDTNQ
jgi:hypothetical protein